MPQYTFSVTATAQGTRLDRFLAESLPASAELSRTTLARLIAQGVVSIDDKPTTTRATPLRAGQKVSLILAENIHTTASSQDKDKDEDEDKDEDKNKYKVCAPLEVLYEDEHLLGFVKPAGLTTHPAPSVLGETLVDRLKAHCAPNLAGYPQDPRCGIVHRLDKETSGVMVAAKTEQARLALSAMFATHDLQRHYLALCWGVPTLKQGTIDASLARHPVQRTRVATLRDSQQGKGRTAITHYRVLQAFQVFGDAACLLVCTLETGRTHQIRAHMSSIGHALIGDKLYADPNPSPRRRACAANLPVMPRQALHAEQLAFTHPISAKALSFSSPPPHDFQTLLQTLKESR